MPYATIINNIHDIILQILFNVISQIDDFIDFSQISQFLVNDILVSTLNDRFNYL